MVRAQFLVWIHQRPNAMRPSPCRTPPPCSTAFSLVATPSGQTAPSTASSSWLRGLSGWPFLDRTGTRRVARQGYADPSSAQRDL